MTNTEQKKILTETVEEYKNEIIESVLKQISEKFPKDSFSEIACARDILLIFKCVLNDILDNSTNHSTKAAFSYVYHYNKLIFSTNKERILFSIKCMQTELVKKLPKDDALKNAVKRRFDLMYEVINQKIVTEVSWWTYAAKVLPYIALSGLVLTDLIAPDNLYTVLAIAIIVIFFGVGVFWWWWAIWKIAYIFSSIKNAQHNVIEVSNSINRLKVDIDAEFGIRKRGKSIPRKSKQPNGDKDRV